MYKSVISKSFFVIDNLEGNLIIDEERIVPSINATSGNGNTFGPGSGAGSASIPSGITAPISGFGIYPAALMQTLDGVGQFMSVSPTLSYFVGGGLLWTASKTAEVHYSTPSQLPIINYQSYPIFYYCTLFIEFVLLSYFIELFN